MSSYFSSSNNVLYDPTFITATNYINEGASSKAVDQLNLHVVAEALHNSDERCDAPKCLPETRVAVQQEILSWIRYGDQDDQPKKILWLTGPAGTGKTAIAGSIAEICEELGLLAGSFFFSSYAGSESRRSKKGLVATLAYGLLQHESLKPLRDLILSVIGRDGQLFRKRLKDQVKAILLRPLQDAQAQLDPSSLPKAFVIDAVDEVEAANARKLEQHERREVNEADQIEILNVLLEAARDIHFPFRIIVVSRPERAIKHFFAQDANLLSRQIFLDQNYDPDSDIRFYLKANLTEIRRRYNLPASWASEDDIQKLVDNASGQFIYAATVARFLRNGCVPPYRRLEHVLNLYPADDAAENSMAALDTFYTDIIMSSPEPSKSVCWISVLCDPIVSKHPALFVKQFSQEDEGQAEYLLENLSSLIFIPDPQDYASPYKLYHRSLIDFLAYPRRCGETLNGAFLDGELFLARRYHHILQTLSPDVPLANADELLFFRRFLDCLAEILMSGGLELLPPPVAFRDLPASNSGRWMDRVVTSFTQEPDRASQLAFLLYDCIHLVSYPVIQKPFPQGCGFASSHSLPRNVSAGCWICPVSRLASSGGPASCGLARNMAGVSLMRLIYLLREKMFWAWRDECNVKGISTGLSGPSFIDHRDHFNPSKTPGPSTFLHIT